VDKPQFEAALLNMVVNSRDARPEGGMITITTFLQRKADPSNLASAEQDMVHMSVTDNGVGIPVEIQERGFEPFFTTKEVGRGSGLGLSQIFGFAAHSGGQATLQSTPGQGHDGVPLSAVERPTPGSRAMEKLRDEGPFDVVVSDIAMPGKISSLDVAREVAENHPDVRVIHTSGDPQSHFSPLPMYSQFLSKPYRVRQLVELLHAAG